VAVLNGTDSAIRTKIPIFSGKFFDAEWFAPWRHKLSYTNEGGKLKVVVPAELKVESAFLADADGLVIMRNCGAGMNEWIEDERMRQWAKEAGSADRYRYGYGYGGLSETSKTGMPEPGTLRKFLVDISFPSGLEDNADFRSYMMDNREKSMDIRRRVKDGRCLLLFLSPSSGFFPVNIQACRPDTAEVNLVRVRAPDKIPAKE
jgi:hypothetical protein